MSRTQKILTLGLLDLIAIITANCFAFLYMQPIIDNHFGKLILFTCLNLFFYYLMALPMGIYSKINRFTGILDTIKHLTIVTTSSVLATVVFYIVLRSISLRFAFLSFLTVAVIIPGARIIWRIMSEHHEKRRLIEMTPKKNPLKTLVVGAGEGGSLFARYLKFNPTVDIIGFVDDDPNKLHTKVYSVPVLGRVKDIPELAETYQIEQITIAIPSLAGEELTEIIQYASQTNAIINQMPSVEKVLAGEHRSKDFKPVDIKDLLGREEVNLNDRQISRTIVDQTILVSGAGGSIGSEICRQIMNYIPRRLILLGHGEFSIYKIHQELSQHEYADQIDLIQVIADIQDRERMFEVMQKYQPDIVYHAAAHKHVPLMEANPREAVKNNIYGTKNIAEAAKASDVSSFVMISTDKAVNPPNVMGSSKRVAEMIVTSLNETDKTTFCAVRFGNVLGSSGSVVPLFTKQIANGGPVTVTDFRMRRYFMTIPEASRLVIQAGVLSKGGEIFILDMGEPVKIHDLAKQMIRLSGHSDDSIEIIETGIRPGEKLYEELLTSEENVEEQVYEKIFVGKVHECSAEEVMSFVESLDEMSDEDLKKALVAFANSAQ